MIHVFARIGYVVSPTIPGYHWAVTRHGTHAGQGGLEIATGTSFYASIDDATEDLRACVKAYDLENITKWAEEKENGKV